MRKLIDIPEEILEPLKIKAVLDNKDLKNYIQDLLVKKVKGNDFFISQVLKDKYERDFDLFIQSSNFKKINYNVFLSENGEYWIREEIDSLMNSNT